VGKVERLPHQEEEVERGGERGERGRKGKSSTLGASCPLVCPLLTLNSFPPPLSHLIGKLMLSVQQRMMLRMPKAFHRS